MIFLLKRLYTKLFWVRYHWVLNYFKYYNDFKVFKATHGVRFDVLNKDMLPCLYDKDTLTSFDKHYVYHTAWAARRINQLKPIEHIDISSLTYFSTLLSAFIPVKFYDYRPARIQLENLLCGHADITKLSFATDSVDCLSCMHVVEHIGLGRYGDPLDIDGDLKAISELKRVVSKKGNLFFVVPIGKPRIMFNAHRIYSFDQIISYFDGFDLMEFTLIPDQTDEGLIFNATKELSDQQIYACGCFWFQKEE